MFSEFLNTGAIAMLFPALLSLLLLSGCSFFRPKQIQPPALATLLTDLKLYTLNHAQTLHAGNLYEHLMWTHYAATRLLEEPSPWTEGFIFSERDKELLNLAALIHDIGKAGRKELFNATHKDLRYHVVTDNHSHKATSVVYTHDAKEHVQVGFEYIAELFYPIETRQQYTLASSMPMSIQPLFHQLNISLEEQKVIAILVGMHYDFGMIKAGNLTVQDYLNNLKRYAKIVDYKTVDEKLLRLAVLIQVADVIGTTHVAPCKTWLFQNPVDLPEVRHIENPAYHRFGYDTDAPLKLFYILLEEFKQQQAQ